MVLLTFEYMQNKKNPIEKFFAKVLLTFEGLRYGTLYNFLNIIRVAIKIISEQRASQKILKSKSKIKTFTS